MAAPTAVQEGGLEDHLRAGVHRGCRLLDGFAQSVEALLRIGDLDDLGASCLQTSEPGRLVLVAFLPEKVGGVDSCRFEFQDPAGDVQVDVAEVRALLEIDEVRRREQELVV